jgi:hypothetical protein
MEAARKDVAALVCDTGHADVSIQSRSIAVKAKVVLRTACNSALESVIFVGVDVEGKGCRP